MNEKQFLLNLQSPAGNIDAVIDTDAYNEVDDQFAIAYLLRMNDKINTRAIYAAPFLNSKSSSPADGMEKSYNEIIKLLKLSCREDMIENTYRGSTQYLHDEITPVISPAAKHLAELANGYSPKNPLYVVAIGAITNVASAILINPKMTENTVIVWLGGHAFDYKDTNEFNMMQDVAAARVVFDSKAPVVLLPCCGVVDRFITTGPELSYWLGGKNPLCDYLAENVINEVEPHANGKPWSRIIWDVTAVGWLANKDGKFMSDRLEKSPVAEYDNTYSHSDDRHYIKYVYNINRDRLFGDLVEKLTK